MQQITIFLFILLVCQNIVKAMHEEGTGSVASVSSSYKFPQIELI
jgi:hypothetical protein